MIGKLSGRIDSVAEDHLILDVGGVGYLVHAPVSTLARLKTGEAASLAIETRITDETIRLYGFLSPAERAWFRLLQNVQGVGARVALGVLSTLATGELEKALALSDKAAIGRAPGVGPKLATRIVTELKDKAPAMMLAAGGSGPAAVAVPRGAAADAVAALTKLGYGQSQAAEMAARAAQALGEDAPVDALIRSALQSMAR